MSDVTKIPPETLSAFFDGELDADEAARIQGALGSDPTLREELEDWRLLRTMTAASLEAEAAAVPEARFEQIWDQIDATLDREAGARASTANAPSLWNRIVDAVYPYRFVLAGAGAVAAVALVLVPDRISVNEPDQVASVRPQETKTPPMKSPPTQPPPVRAVTPETEIAAAPESNEADIEMIEFGGKTGRIGKIEGGRGTTTVIWVTEEEPVDSERSL